jgi:3-oxoacyl-[acyl-carrier protein] reductase
MIALVTGGSGRIGGAIAAHLRERGYEVLAPTHDEMWVEYAKHVIRYMQVVPQIDLLVCAHGLYGDVASVEESDSTMWREAIAVNLIGTYNVCHYAIKKLKQGGQIITLAGGGGMLDPMPMISSYACSKAAIVSLTKTMAAELKGRIRANCIFPGMQDSKIHDEIMAIGEKANPHYQAIKKMRETGEGAVPVDNTIKIIDHLIDGAQKHTSGTVFFARTLTYSIKVAA